jgi:hypothetical protein
MIDHVIKLLLPTYPAGAAEYEAEIAYKVQETGPPVPAVKAVIEHAGRFGILYERIAGVSLLRVITANPWLLARAARTASCRDPCLPRRGSSFPARPVSA